MQKCTQKSRSPSLLGLQRIAHGLRLNYKLIQRLRESLTLFSVSPLRFFFQFRELVDNQNVKLLDLRL